MQLIFRDPCTCRNELRNSLGIVRAAGSAYYGTGKKRGLLRGENKGGFGITTKFAETFLRFPLFRFLSVTHLH